MAAATIRTSDVTKPLDPYKAKSHEDLPLEQKVEDLVAFISDIKYGMLTTKMSTNPDLLGSRCMVLAGKEHGGIDLLFHANVFSGKALDLSMHPSETNMSFLDPAKGSWASISGTASTIADPDIVKRTYSPALKAWMGDLGDGVHDGGPNDPRIGVIRLEAKVATHSVAKRGMFGEAIEMVKGAAKGEVPDITSIREFSQAELNEWRRTH